MSVLKKSDVIMSAVQTLFYDDSGITGIMYQREVNAEHLLGIYREGIDPETFNCFLRSFFGTPSRETRKTVVGGVKYM